jgi:hypothetical protein
MYMCWGVCTYCACKSLDPQFSENECNIFLNVCMLFMCVKYKILKLILGIIYVYNV